MIKEKIKVTIYLIKKLNHFKLLSFFKFAISIFLKRKFTKLKVKPYLLKKYIPLIVRTDLKYGDIYAINEVLIDNAYFRHVDILKNNYTTILDIGAHIGTFSVYAYYLFKPKIIVTLEPDKENIIILKANLKLNNIPSIIIVGAISSKDGYINFYIRDGKGPLRTTTLNTNVKEIRKVKSFSLDTLIKKHKPQLVKMDCEGAEFQAILNSQLINKLKIIVLEYHEWVGNVRELVNYLNSKGFKVIYKKVMNDLLGILYIKKL